MDRWQPLPRTTFASLLPCRLVAATCTLYAGGWPVSVLSSLSSMSSKWRRPSAGLALGTVVVCLLAAPLCSTLLRSPSPNYCCRVGGRVIPRPCHVSTPTANGNVLSVSTQKASGEPAALVYLVRRPPREQGAGSRDAAPRRKSRHPLRLHNVHLALGVSRREQA